jgi:hypothetical protein
MRAWTGAAYASTRATAASLLSVRTWQGVLSASVARVTGVTAAVRALTFAQLRLRAANLVSAAATNVATAASWLLNASLYANPVVWVGVAVAGAAVLIYKYWKPIAGFFRGLWAGIKQGAQPLAPMFHAVGAALAPVGAAVRAVLGWFGRLLRPVDDVGGRAEALGVRWGRAVGGMLAAVVGLPARFLQAGANIVASLTRGMLSMANRPVELIRRIVQRVRNHLPFSPAREGPLRDIHKIKLIETIANTIRPEPLVSAIRAATAAASMSIPAGLVTAAAAQPAFVSVPAAVAPVGRVAGAGVAGGPAAGGVTLHYAPTYQLAPGGAEDVVQQLRNLDAAQRLELQDMLVRLVGGPAASRDRTRSSSRGE